MNDKLLAGASVMGQVNAAVSGDAQSEARRALVVGTVGAGYWQLIFPAPLEGEFLEYYAQRSVEMLRWLVPAVFALQLAYGVLIGFVADVPNVWFTHSWLPISGVLIFMEVVLLSGKFNRWVHGLVALLATVALSTTLYTMTLLGDHSFVRELSWYVLLQLMVIFSLLRLRFRLVLVTALIPAFLYFLFGIQLGVALDWFAFGQYYGLGVAVCASVAYMVEWLNRTAWLNMQELDIQMQALQALRAKADAEGRRQSLMGEYLGLISGNLTAADVSARTLKFLIGHTQAQLGVVYVVKEACLLRAGGWGLEGGVRTADKLERGETLVGQVAENGRRLRLTNLPADYHQIRTGTGSAVPREILIEPAKHQGATLAVLELGSLQSFPEADLDLVGRIGDALAAALVAANAREALARAGSVLGKGFAG